MPAHVLCLRVRYASTCPWYVRGPGVLRNLLLDSAPSAPRAHPRADDNPLSPITRETLRSDVVIPSRNLRERIAAHEGEVLDFASQATEVVAGRAVAEALGEQADDGVRKRAAEAPAVGSSSSALPKRARR
eukprot:1464913-Prymnesium_polylepis.1